MTRSRSHCLSACLVALTGLLHPLVGITAEGVPVVVSEVQQRQIFRPVEITGTVTSPRVARLSPATGGLVQTLHVDIGDVVAAGDILLELDPELAQLQWQGARADRQRAAAALADARRRLQEAQVLAPQRSIAKTAVRDLEAEVAVDEADLQKADAESAYRRALLDRHQLRAPFAGVVSEKLTEQGEWVTQGQGVVELVATGGLRLDFAVSEDYLATLTADAAVEFTLSAMPSRRFKGRVQTIVPVTDPGARTFLLRVAAVDGEAPLRPGMSVVAVVRIPDRDAGQGLVVPRDATLRYPDGRMVVWTLEQTGAGPVAREQKIDAGRAFDGVVEVRGGLSAGDRVVVEGNEALQDGQLLRIVDDR